MGLQLAGNLSINLKPSKTQNLHFWDPWEPPRSTAAGDLAWIVPRPAHPHQAPLGLRLFWGFGWGGLGRGRVFFFFFPGLSEFRRVRIGKDIQGFWMFFGCFLDAFEGFWLVKLQRLSDF